MTNIISSTASNGDQVQIHINPSSTPIVYVNGVLQDEQYFAKEYNQLEPWKPWFAWRPVRLHTGERVWWKNIYRRTAAKTYANMNDWPFYEYGTIFDVIRGDR